MPGKQLIFIGAGILFVIITIKHAVGGRRRSYWGNVVRRDTAPASFWFTIALDACISTAFLTWAVLYGPR